MGSKGDGKTEDQGVLEGFRHGIVLIFKAEGFKKSHRKRNGQNPDEQEKYTRR